MSDSTSVMSDAKSFMIDGIMVDWISAVNSKQRPAATTESFRNLSVNATAQARQAKKNKNRNRHRDHPVPTLYLHVSTNIIIDRCRGGTFKSKLPILRVASTCIISLYCVLGISLKTLEYCKKFGFLAAIDLRIQQVKLSAIILLLLLVIPPLTIKLLLLYEIRCQSWLSDAVNRQHRIFIDFQQTEQSIGRCHQSLLPRFICPQYLTNDLACVGDSQISHRKYSPCYLNQIHTIGPCMVSFYPSLFESL